MKKKIITFSIITIFIIIGIFTSTFAEYLDEIQAKKEEVKYQIEDATVKVDGIELQITGIVEEISKIEGNIGTHEAEISQVELEIQRTQEDINTVTKKLENVEQDYVKQKSALEKRLVALYEAGDTKYLDVLLKSQSLSEFISNYFLISEIASYDTDLLETIEREKNSISAIKETLKEKENQIKEIKKSKEKAVIALENTRLIKNNYVIKLSQEELEIQKQIETYKNELNALEAEIVFLATGNLDSDYVGGVLAWPAPGYTTITSKFGVRFHPIFKINRMHSGVDIGVPTGGYIIAANSGTVVKSTYSSSYGNMVMIDHGGGVATVYGHGDELLVEAGQEVKRGDVIMKAGSTGWSTGPHLHFEVRINGTCVDPLPYITTSDTSIDDKLMEEVNG